jgi:hypothetical protein
MNPKLLLTTVVLLSLGVGHVCAKRAAPKNVTPVISEGVMYSAPHRGRTKGEQNGGFIQAVDLDTGKFLWELQVYQIKYDPKLERDVQEIYITSLELVKGNLEILNEAGDKFVVDLAKRKVISGAGRVYRFKADPP